MQPGAVRPDCRAPAPGRNTAADTLFVSPQTVSAAIAAGLIGELDYVIPSRKPLEDFSLEGFRQRALAAGFLTPAEADGLTLKDGVISGEVRGIPLRCFHPDAKLDIGRPALVHIDLGYFKDLYVNEVKTPVYGLLSDTVLMLQKIALPVYAVTLSYSNQEALFSLDTRFTISNLADVIRDPQLFQGGTPASWSLRAKALYASAMFAETTARELLAKAVQSNPDDPAALYAQSQEMFAQKQPAKGFQLLDRATAIDPGYAYSYYELAQSGIALGDFQKSLKLLKKAAGFFPDNPFIRLQEADLLIQAGQGQEALDLLRELKRLPWSERTHPGVVAHLDEMIEAARASRN